MIKQRAGFSLVEIMIVVMIIALLSAIAIPNLLRNRMEASTASAKATLKALSTSAETYAANNNGLYPTSSDQFLMRSLDGSGAVIQDYCDGVVRNGFVFNCALENTGYNITARPSICGTTGSKSFSVSTGSMITEDAPCQSAGG
jgi:prepilin-type N-terminal cleavage/methylation domain-containing protein